MLQTRLPERLVGKLWRPARRQSPSAPCSAESTRRQQQLVNNVTLQFDQLGAPSIVINTITVERSAPLTPVNWLRSGEQRRTDISWQCCIMPSFVSHLGYPRCNSYHEAAAC